MNGWDALQAYDLVNDGGGNFGFVSPRRDSKLHMREGISALWFGLKLSKEAKRLENEGLTDS